MERETTLFKMFGKFCPQGTIIFNEGETGEEMYYIQSGSVRVKGEQKGERDHFGPGDLLGEESLLGAAPRRVMAESVEDSRLIVIDAHNIENVVRNGPELASSVMGDLLASLDEAWRGLLGWQEKFFLGKMAFLFRDSEAGKGWTIEEASARTEIEDEGVRRVFEALVAAGALHLEGDRYTLIDPAVIDRMSREGA